MTRINMEVDPEAKLGAYELLPDGDYFVQVADYKDTRTQTNRDMVTLEFEVSDGPFFGHKVWDCVVFIPKGDKGHGIMLHKCKCLGMPMDGNHLDFDTSQFQGQGARVKVGQASYRDKNGNEKTRNVIEEYYPTVKSGGPILMAATNATAVKRPSKKVEALNDVPF